MAELLEKNKTNAIAFYDLMFNQYRPAEATEEYIGDVYIQPTCRNSAPENQIQGHAQPDP